ncbi:Lrp/AsnC ligand binding domain-containing protein [Mesorhizobium sp. M0254]|uniref:Lrp/AsnC ligand binding domain-containing protein n=1 Tax=Mesorhizobium sp. M0254 TaxID=2956927 RepID=UPI00333B1BA4
MALPPSSQLTFEIPPRREGEAHTIAPLFARMDLVMSMEGRLLSRSRRACLVPHHDQPQAKALGRVVQALRGLPEVMSVHFVRGAFDVITEIAAPSISELDRTVDVTGEVAGVERNAINHPLNRIPALD